MREFSLARFRVKETDPDVPRISRAWQAVPAVLGGLGLISGLGAQRKQDNYTHEALKSQEPTREAGRAILGLAQGYDPHAEDQKAIAAADQNAAALFKQSLGQLNGNFLTAGGSPTGDTAFNVQATNASNRVMDPLKQFQAQLAATETQRKMAAFAPLLGASAGNASNAYFQAAQMQQPNYGPSLQLFSDLFKKLGAGNNPAVGANYGLGGGDLTQDYGIGSTGGGFA